MNKKYQKILVLGSGALKIGEAGEFDYSGSQAIKALKEEGIATVLVNPNIATIQTSEGFADKVYFLPVTPHFVTEVIKKERPDGILLSFGGQTALNCGVKLKQSGVLDTFHVEVLGTPVATIEDTEDRERFVKRLAQIDVAVPRSQAVGNLKEALHAADEIGYPIMVRIAYALGGLGSGRCADEKELRDRVTAGLVHADQVLIEEYLQGWKEVEYEIVRDRFDNCIAVCNMENFDPLGIHTGESIVVAPSQTLTNREYHHLREVAIKTVRHLGIVGECNIQYALDPKSDRYRVIEVNARLSRSSALASKATGYPLAFVAAKLALGKSLLEVKNSVTGTTTACFEPALDYVVVKIPRWDLKKFRFVSKQIGSGMKSVGEVMAIGRKFEEALQKGLRMCEIGVDGLVGFKNSSASLTESIKTPTDERIFALYQGLQEGMSIDRLYELSHIDPWFLSKLANIAVIEKRLSSLRKQGSHEIPAFAGMTKELLREAKQYGFSDRQIARITKQSEGDIRLFRQKEKIHSSVKQIDTLAAEYPAKTNYLYTTYNGVEDDVSFPSRQSVMVLGSGAYRIGSSVEFDWCSVNAVQSLRKLGFETIMVNCNPETVSTDYDVCDRLYFDELTFETVLDLYEREQPLGIIVATGGQVANNLALKLSKAGVNILGTSAASIDRAENRHKFSALLDELDIVQPAWNEVTSLEGAKKFAQELGYPILVRPSYVLSGAAMAVATSDTELVTFLEKAADVSPEHPVVVSQFILGAKELEIDAVAAKGKLIAYVISEHVENAGVHSGDATMVVPPQRMYLETARKIKSIASRIAEALEINGPFNIQFLAKENEVSVIECNLRASRSFPFVSKVCGTNLIDLAVHIMMEKPLPSFRLKPFNLEYVGVKAPHFSFTRLSGADPILSVEMASTGEVGCLGDDFEEAFLKSLLSVGYRLPIKGILLSTGSLEQKTDFIPAVKELQERGIHLFATSGTAAFYREHGLTVEAVYWPSEKKQPQAIDVVAQGKVDLVVNIPKSFHREELSNGYHVRRAAADFGIPLITNLQLAKRFVEAISRKELSDLTIKSWQEYQ